MKKQPVPTSIRLNEALFYRIKEEAEAEKRSITAQIEYNLEKYYEILDAVTPPIKRNDRTETI